MVNLWYRFSLSSLSANLLWKWKFPQRMFLKAPFQMIVQSWEINQWILTLTKGKVCGDTMYSISFEMECGSEKGQVAQCFELRVLCSSIGRLIKRKVIRTSKELRLCCVPTQTASVSLFEIKEALCTEKTSSTGCFRSAWLIRQLQLRWTPSYIVQQVCES